MELEAAYMGFDDDDVEPQGSIIERPRNAGGDAGCTRAF
jgi:hypothetical protein